MNNFLKILVLGLITCNISYADCIKGDCKNNKGTMSYADGSKYVGDFKYGKINGLGTMSYSDGSKYVGEFKYGKINGLGTMIYADGSKYVGEFKDSNMSGRGTMTYADGSKYVGEFKDSLYFGYGNYEDKDANVKSGHWKYGVLINKWYKKLTMKRLLVIVVLSLLLNGNVYGAEQIKFDKQFNKDLEILSKLNSFVDNK